MVQAAQHPTWFWEPQSSWLEPDPTAVLLGPNSTTPGSRPQQNAGISADPTALFTTLKSLGQVTLTGRTGTGAGGLEIFTFSYKVAADQSTAAHIVSGTVKVHSSTHLVAAVDQRTTIVGAHPEIADGEPTHLHSLIEFSDYGTPVKVVAPDGAKARLRQGPVPSPSAS
jgi:hypothetical protein